MPQNNVSGSVTNLDDYRRSGSREAEPALKSGGGGGTFDGMEPRVAALEKGFERIEKKLDTLLTDVAEMKGQLKGMPSAIAFGELKGRVDSLPTTAKVASLLGIAVAIVTLITKWDSILAILHK
ncbi:MAG: hypothetical protein J0G33_02825 [Afipia felis]|nr:hypothetical protein [Afipia felis]